MNLRPYEMFTNVRLTSDIELRSNYQYFNIRKDNLIFDGSGFTITLNYNNLNPTLANHYGLFKNNSACSYNNRSLNSLTIDSDDKGYDNITIKNFKLFGKSSRLVDNYGWITCRRFGKGCTLTLENIQAKGSNYGNSEGGLVGNATSYRGVLIVRKCSLHSMVSTNGGGLLGYQSPDEGLLILEESFSTGSAYVYSPDSYRSGLLLGGYTGRLLTLFK